MRSFGTVGRRGRRQFLGRGVALGAGVAALQLAACGGGNRAATSSSAQPSLPAFVSTSTASSETSKPKRGGTLAVEWQFNQSLWDPYRVSTGVVQHYSSIWETLVTSNPKNLEIEPLLVEKWEEVEVGAHYILKVRQGANWENKAPTNGRPFDAEDVAYNLKYASGLLNPSQAGQIARSSWHRGLAAANAIDKTTVELKLSTPNAAILAAAADMRQYAIPKELPDQVPFTEYAKFPSIGPWIIKEYRDGEAATYERNPNYWNQPLPYADRAIIKWYGDPASKVAGLLSGDVNMIRVYGRQEIDQIQKSGKDVSVLPFQFRAHGTHYINAERIPDKRVWKALHYLFDYQKANDSIYGKGLWDYSGPINRALPGASPSEKIAQLPGWNPATKEADRKEAAALLRAAGFPDGEGLSIEMLMGSGSGTSFDIGVYHQADVKTIAPKAKFELRPAPDPASYQRALAGREYQMAGGYQIYEALDPRLAAENWKSKASRNYANYSNPQVDQLIDKSFAQPFKEAQGTIAEIEKLLLADLPLIIPNGVFETMGASNKIKGLADRLGPGSGGVYNEVHKARKFVWLEQ